MTAAGVTLDDMKHWRRPAGVGRAYLDGRFGQLHYRSAGPGTDTGVPVLFIHASPASGRMWEAALAELGRDRLALAPDTPGFGDSDAPPVPPEIPDYAATMGDFLDALGVKQVDVVGYHTGSKTCVELALQRPELVRKLALVSAPIYSDAELAKQKHDYAPETIARDGSHLAWRWNFSKTFRKPDVPLIVAHRSLAESLKGGEKSPWGHRAAFNYHHAENLPKVRQPVLIFNFGDDLTAPTARAADYVANGQVVDVPDFSHGSIDVHAATFAGMLRSFFDADAAPSEAGVPAKPPPGRPSVQAGAVRRSFHDGPYGFLHVRQVGVADAPRTPFVMFHMSPNSGRIYDALVAEMGRDRLALAPDTPGFGESDAPAAAPTIEDYAACMGGLIDRLGLGRVDVMGYHTGSQTAMELARQRPDLVGKVVMVSAPLYTEEERALRHTRNTPLAVAEDGSHLIDRFAGLWRFYGADVPDTVVARNFCESLRGGPVAWWGHRAAFTYAMADNLPGVRQPILLLNPDDDLAEQTPRAAPLLANGRIHNLPYSHGMLDAHTAEIGQILRQFLDT
ncbi:MAG: alpha/beta hydrolase [Alphaproteobacteria bacterium]